MSDKYLQKGKKAKNKNQFGTLHEETENQENENEKEQENENGRRYPYRKLTSSSSSSSGSKGSYIDHHKNSSKNVIYEEHTKQSSKNVILKMNEIINDYPEKYYKKHLKSDWLRFFVNLFSSFLHIVIIFAYITSITSCSKSLTLNECIEKIDINYYFKVGLLCCLSAFLISLILVLIIAKFASIYHLPLIIIELISFIAFNHQDNIYKNGLFSFKLLCSFIAIIFLLLIFFVFFLIKLGTKKYFYSVFFFFVRLFHAQYIYVYT